MPQTPEKIGEVICLSLVPQITVESGHSSWPRQCPRSRRNRGSYADFFKEVRAASHGLSQVQEDTVEMTQFILHLRIVEQISDIPGTQIQDQFPEVVKNIPQKLVQQRIVEQIVDVPVQQITQKNVEVVQMIPQERVAERVVDQMVSVPVPQITTTSWSRLWPCQRHKSCGKRGGDSACSDREHPVPQIMANS